MKVSAVIVAAGGSRRMGFDKLEADLAGRPVLAHSILAFQKCDSVSEIRIVTSAEKVEGITALANELQATKFIECVEGGAERHLSVWNGLKRIGEGCDLVAVHDGARPLVSPEAITDCAVAAGDFGAASLAHRVADTLKRGNDEDQVVASVSREDLWAMETPQIFRRELILEAYLKILETNELVTDEVSATQALGHEVHLVDNSQPNFKITVPGDLLLAEAVLKYFPYSG